MRAMSSCLGKNMADECKLFLESFLKRIKPFLTDDNLEVIKTNINTSLSEVGIHDYVVDAQRHGNSTTLFLNGIHVSLGNEDTK